MFLPENFKVPELKGDSYHARKLTYKDTDLDYAAVMSSIDCIRKTRGGSWPKESLTLEKDMLDLCWHQREFEFGLSYAFTVMNDDESECLGCIYFYPANKWSDEKVDHEVDISWWVTQKMYDQGFYETLSRDVKEWVQTEWPFKKVNWANEHLPENF